MANGPPSLERPNGTATVFYGNAASCTRNILDLQDWNDAMKRPDKALWALSAQSGTILDGIGFPGYTSKNGTYRGYA